MQKNMLELYPSLLNWVAHYNPQFTLRDRRHHQIAAVQNQKAVSVHLQSKQILSFGCARHSMITVASMPWWLLNNKKRLNYCTNIPAVHFFYSVVSEWILLYALSANCGKIATGISLKSWLCHNPKIKQIRVIFTHSELWVALARHNFKWVKI